MSLGLCHRVADTKSFKPDVKYDLPAKKVFFFQKFHYYLSIKNKNKKKTVIFLPHTDLSISKQDVNTEGDEQPVCIPVKPVADER